MSMTEEQRKAVSRVEKLLRLAAGNRNAEEAASAAAKAQQILEDYNLTMAAVEQAQGVASGKREELKQRGGMFVYERRLWNQVAELNFCIYVTVRVREYEPRFRRDVWRFKHRLIGRTVNTAVAIALGSYLQGTIERLCRERLHERGEGGAQFFSRWAVSFREGVADEVIWRLYERRQQRMRDEDRAQRAAAERAMAGTSIATGLTLRTLAQQERDANNDFRFGEGWSARQAEERARRAAAEAAAEAEFAAWAEANPEAARRKEEERRAAEAKRRARPDRQEKPKDWGAYRAGSDYGKRVSIDPQVDEGRIAGRISHAQ